MLKLFTFVPNRADLIDVQMRCLQKYLGEEFILTVFNNASLGYDRRRDNKKEKIEIDGTCARLGINVIEIQKEQELVDFCQTTEKSCTIFDRAGFYSNGNVAHAYALCWAWKHVISKEIGPVCILDFDMFLKEPIKLTDYLVMADALFVGQSKPGMNDKKYAWPGFVLMDLPKFPNPETLNWMCGQVDGASVDVGGQTCRYFESHPEIRLVNLGLNNFPDDSHVDYQILHLGDKELLHYRGGSNWEDKTPEFHQKKTEWLKKELGI